MRKLLLTLFMSVSVSVPALAVPAPGWQCMPYAGVAEFEVADTACTGHAPVFVYLGDGQAALAYFMLTLPVEGNCFEGHGGWSPVELGAQLVGGVGAHTLRGEGLSIDAIPGAPSDQSCLDSLRVPWPQTRVRVSRVDESHLLLTVEPLAVPLQGKASK